MNRIEPLADAGDEETHDLRSVEEIDRKLGMEGFHGAVRERHHPGPSSASCSAIVLPIPLLAHATTATLPSILGAAGNSSRVAASDASAVLHLLNSNTPP